MVAYIKEISVKRYKWLNEDVFKRGVALCQSIPGATAIQMAGYVGLVKRGLPGAIATFSGFGMPAFVFMLLLSWLYTIFGRFPAVTSLFNGLNVIVVAIVAFAAYGFARDTIKTYKDIIIAFLSALFFWFSMNPFFVIITSAAMGIIIFREQKNPTPDEKTGDVRVSFYPIISFILLTALGIIFLFLINKRLLELALLMLKVDLFAFGGGFASLPLMLQEVVHARNWIDNKTFMDGIALGQITPGPIIITATFVGFITNGIWGAVVATVAVFTPSFILLILCANIFHILKRSIYFQNAIKGVFASFVGLLLFVTFKFANDVPWNTIKVTICLCTAVALYKKIDVLYIVIAGGTISIFLL